jgi:CheY-like chemotaxis protein
MARDGFYSVESLRLVHVLVVCDDVTSRRLLEQVLRYCGALCTLAASPPDAFRILDQVKPDLVVASLLRCGVTEGRDFIRRLRSRKPEDAGTIAVLWLGPDLGPDGQADMQPDATLPLPVHPWELCGALSTLVNTDGPSPGSRLAM